MSHPMVDIVHTTVELETLEIDLTVEVSRLIRERLENSSLDFIGGNDLDILIDTNVDILSIVNHAYIIPNDATTKEKRTLGLKKL